MPFPWPELLFSFVLPFVMAVSVGWLTRWGLPAVAVGPLAIGAAFPVSFALLENGLSWPRSHWHWMIWIIAAASLVSPLVSSDGRKNRRQSGWAALGAIGAAWCLVPGWSDLDPSRGAYCTVVAVLIWCVCLLLDYLSPRLPSGTATLTAAIWLGSIMIWLVLGGSVRFGVLMAPAAAACAGLALMEFRGVVDTPLRGSAFLLAVAAAGGMLIGQVYSFSGLPVWSYLAIPLTFPLTGLWLVFRFRHVPRHFRLAATVLPPVVMVGVMVAGLLSRSV